MDNITRLKRVRKLLEAALRIVPPGHIQEELINISTLITDEIKLEEMHEQTYLTFQR